MDVAVLVNDGLVPHFHWEACGIAKCCIVKKKRVFVSSVCGVERNGNAALPFLLI